jgi:crotonobetainyl-CoA:carnitine CoA-transferase CaiB-like acyl-CoA transferase
LRFHDCPHPPTAYGVPVQALEGIRILDLSGGIAGPLGVLHLAEHGADVIKVEPPGGRPERESPASRVFNRSRRSVTIDLKKPAGIVLFRELCATADVLVEAFAAGTMARLGLDYASLRDDFPRLVYCSVPAWPSGSRYQDLPGYEALVHARTGQHWENTTFRRGPVFLHSPVASLGAMFLVPTGIMSALLYRQRSGRGQHVEVSLVQGALSLTTQNWNWTDRGQFQLPKTRPPGIHQPFLYECADGQWVHTSILSGVTPTRSEASILGFEERSPLDLMAMSPEERAGQDRRKRDAYKRRQRSGLIDEMRAAGISCEAVVAPSERFDHPQLRETGAVAEVTDPEAGRTTQLGVTLFLQGTPGRVKGPQPPAGAHTAEVIQSLGHDEAQIRALHAGGVI